MTATVILCSLRMTVIEYVSTAMSETVLYKASRVSTAFAVPSASMGLMQSEIALTARRE